MIIENLEAEKRNSSSATIVQIAEAEKRSRVDASFLASTNLKRSSLSSRHVWSKEPLPGYHLC